MVKFDWVADLEECKGKYNSFCKQCWPASRSKGPPIKKDGEADKETQREDTGLSAEQILRRVGGEQPDLADEPVQMSPALEMDASDLDIGSGDESASTIVEEEYVRRDATAVHEISEAEEPLVAQIGEGRFLDLRNFAKSR